MKNLATLLEKEKITLGQYLYIGKHIRFRGAEFDMKTAKKLLSILPAMYVQYARCKEINTFQMNNGTNFLKAFNVRSWQKVGV